MVNDMHAKLGHCLEALVRKAAQYYDWRLTHGTMPPCQDCTTGKGQQKDVVKESDHAPSEVLGEHIFIHIASIKREIMKTRGTARCSGFWLLMSIAE